MRTKDLWAVVRYFAIGALFGLLMSLAPLWLGFLGNPHVTEEWIKARAFEFQHQGSEGVDWSKESENTWYFEKVQYGARFLSREGGESCLIFAPNGKGERLYMLYSDGLITYITDPLSKQYSWAEVKQMDVKQVSKLLKAEANRLIK